jgi:hypothetical protein
MQNMLSSTVPFFQNYRILLSKEGGRALTLLAIKEIGSLTGLFNN